jgi:nitrate reductase NapE component
LAVLLAVSLLLMPAHPALAQGPGPGEGQAGPFVLVEEADAGGYHARVWQSPERLVVSSVQVIIELTDAETGAVIDDAVVKVYGTPSDEGQRQVSPALNSPATPKYYQANIVLDNPGLWAFDVDIEGPLGDQRITYSSEVHQRSRAGTSLLLGTLMFALVGVAFVGGIGYLWWSGRRNRRQLSSQRS